MCSSFNLQIKCLSRNLRYDYRVAVFNTIFTYDHYMINEWDTEILRAILVRPQLKLCQNLTPFRISKGKYLAIGSVGFYSRVMQEKKAFSLVLFLVFLCTNNSEYLCTLQIFTVTSAFMAMKVREANQCPQNYKVEGKNLLSALKTKFNWRKETAKYTNKH